MKKIKIYSVITLMLLLTACSSNEHKANKLIKQYMFESLYDYKSYEPTKTIVEPLKPELYFDEEVIEYAKTGIKNAEDGTRLKEEVEQAEDDMEFAASLYYSSLQDNYHYKKAKKQYEEAKTALDYAERETLVCVYNVLAIHEELELTPSNENLGWKVTHKFRCKNRGGNIALGEYIFLIDNEFKEILNVYDTDDYEYACCIEFINYALEQAPNKDAIKAKIEELEK